MNLETTLRLYNSADFMGPGAIATPSFKTPKVQADASASASNVAWTSKRKMEKSAGRNLELFEFLRVPST